MASIRASGGIGGGQLKKVSDSERRDRSAAKVPGGTEASVGGRTSSPTPNAGAEGGLAGAIAAALEKRKAKVSASGTFGSDYCRPSVLILMLQMMKMMTTTGMIHQKESDLGNKDAPLKQALSSCSLGEGNDARADAAGTCPIKKKVVVANHREPLPSQSATSAPLSVCSRRSLNGNARQRKHEPKKPTRVYTA